MLDPSIDSPPAPAADQEQDETSAALVEQDLLVEDVSIDGMCGVY
jgi:mycofactocin precursor